MPAYKAPKGAEEIVMFRAVIREDLTLRMVRAADCMDGVTPHGEGGCIVEMTVRMVRVAVCAWMNSEGSSECILF